MPGMSRTTVAVPDSLTLRRVSAADAVAVAEVIRAAGAAVSSEPEATSPADLADWWRLVDLESDSWILEEESRIAAVAVALVRGEALDAEGWVHPDFMNRGFGSALLDLTEERAADCGACTIRHDCLAQELAARTLLERRGYRDVRHFYRMVIDLDEGLPEPIWPDGLRVDTLRPAEARPFYDALNEAFADEWNFQRLPYDEWRRLRVDSPDFDPTVCWVVRDGEEVAAVLRGDPERFGLGWIGALGVRKPWRRQGLGRALLLHAFAEFRRRGQRRAGLGVDAENSTGATRLYERAGMHVQFETIVYGKQLR